MENKRYAVINNYTNICENIVVWNGQNNWHPPANTHVICIESLEVGIGFKYENETWTDVRFESENTSNTSNTST